MTDRYADLPVVGLGPQYARTDASPAWRRRLSGLAVGEEVDVLLDDGRIVRTTLRAVDRDGLLERAGPWWVVWLVGFGASYAAGRVRPAGGWWRTRGCGRVTP